MNSPPDPGSPSVSTPSSGSPPPDEVNTQSNTSRFMDIASHITSSFSGSNSSKRRLPGGSSFGASASNRDHKTRRRGDSGRQGTIGGSGGNWDGLKEGKREKEDHLIDSHIVEYLRKEIGDPFQEGLIKRSS